MRVIASADQLQPGTRSVFVAIGVFDGVHVGHQAVLARALEDARAEHSWAVAITFDRHPNAVVAPDRAPPLIYSLSQKLEALGESGLDATWLIRFDQEVRKQTGESFVRSFVREFGNVGGICVGEGFSFGHKRSGNLALLERLGLDLGFRVDGVSAVKSQAEVVSSTRIRELIAVGDLAAASRLLGRPYALAGMVSVGDQRGRTLGFPTANMDVAGRALPPPGVYAVRSRVDGSWYDGVANLGVRPTITDADPALQFEVHLLDFGKVLYGRELEVTFERRLREERRFESLELLKQQIAQDIAAARECLGQRV